MNKVYTRINWHNYPNTTTPLNETNLNKMDYALDIIDGRVIALDTGKADLGQNGLVPLFQLPANSKIVQNDTARFALDSDEVNNGFIVVVQQPTVRMYLVVDNDNLDTEAGYQAFSADANWNTLINRPTNLAYLAGDDEELPSVSPVLRESSLQNNLVTTLPNYPLDARQGKVLDDKITTLNSNLTEFASIISVDFPSATIAALGFSSQDITSIIPSGMTPISCRLKRTGQSNALIPYIYTYGRTIYVQIYNAYNGQNNQQCTVEVTCIKQPA